jgi:uncharacterized damage-inducible protein DinB
VGDELNLALTWSFDMTSQTELRASLLTAWRTNNRVTMQLIQSLPPALWDVAVPGIPQRTIRAIAAHLHNARCSWLKTLGREHVPPSKGYVWRNLSLDVGHVLTYFVAHESHHRGQIVMVARQMGHRLPKTVDAALWQWKMEKSA